MVRHITPLLLAAAVAACGSSGGNGGDAGGPGGGGGNGGASGPHTASLMDTVGDYLAVIRNSGNSDDCIDRSRPHLCPTGPRSGTRTGTAVHNWMRSRLAAIPGMRDVDQQTFQVPRFAPAAWRIRTGDGFEPASLPWFFSGITQASGIQAPLVDVGNAALLETLMPQAVEGRIVLMEGELLLNGESGVTERRLGRLKNRGAAAAVVFFPDAPDNEIIAHNWDTREGLGDLPVLLVGKEDGRRLQNHAGEVVDFVLAAEYRDGPRSVPASVANRSAFSQNTIGWLPGHDDSRWIVIGTPMNTWLLGGGERAPGVAIFLELARALGERAARDGALPYPVYFTATGGHEIWQFGLQRFLSCVDSERVGAYIHLGSGLVSRGYSRPLGGGEPSAEDGLSRTRTLTVSENPLLRLITGPAFSDPALKPLFNLPPALFNPGESRVAWQAGIPLVSLSGTNAWHHTAADDESQIVIEALEPMARAWQEVVDGLLDSNLDLIRFGNIGADLIAIGTPEGECAGVPKGFTNAPG